MPSRVEYEDEHRLFLQGIMSKGVLDNKEVQALFVKTLKVCSIDVPDKKKDLLDLLFTNITTINDELESLGLLIKKGVDEDSGESCFMLINTKNRMVGQSRDLGTKVQTQFSAAELDYLRLLATEILQSDDKTISSRNALNIVDNVGAGKKLSMSEAEASINKFISCRWLKTVQNQIALDVRFLGEMENWMVEVVGNVAKCQLCRKLVVRGIYCTCEQLVGWHKYCLAKQAKAGVDTKCKKCKEVVHPANIANGSSESQPAKRKAVNGGMEEEEEAEAEGSQAQAAGRRRRRDGGTEEEEAEGSQAAGGSRGRRGDMPPPARPGRRRVNVESSDSE